MTGGNIAAWLMLALLAQAPPPDVKGWHGAEWGMTIDQVKAAIGAQLEPVESKSTSCAEGIPRGASIKTSAPIEAGTLSATARFCFSDKQDLATISLEFMSQPRPRFESVRDELKAKYGTPTADDRKVVAGGTLIIETAKWLLPSTEIICSFSEATSFQGFEVIYRKRLPSVF